MSARRLVAALLLLLPSMPLGAAPPEEKPFPVERTAILREGRVRYIVEGRKTIGPGVEISVQKDVYVIGRGEDPTIVVEGALKVHGVSLREVIFEGVTVELAPEYRDVQLDMAIFRKGGGVITAKDKPSKGKLFIENVSFQDSARLDVAFANGHVDLSSVNSGAETHIRGVDDSEETRNKVKLKIRACELAGLVVENVYDATVLLSHLDVGRTEFRDCRSLVFDGNKVNASSLEFHQTVAGGFKGTRIQKCDIYSDQVLFHAPRKDGNSVDKIVMDKCWFKGEMNVRTICEKVIHDADDDERNGARVKVYKPNPRPHELAGAIDR